METEATFFPLILLGAAILLLAIFFYYVPFPSFCGYPPRFRG